MLPQCGAHPLRNAFASSYNADARAGTLNSADGTGVSLPTSAAGEDHCSKSLLRPFTQDGLLLIARVPQ